MDAETVVDLSPEWTCMPHEAPVDQRVRAWCLQMAVFGGVKDAVKVAGQFERFVTGAVKEVA